MPRPRKPRLVRCDPGATYFKPRGIPLRDLEELALGVDGLEAIRLADVDGLDQTAAAALMGVSRSTFSRLVAEARRTVATALVRGAALRIEGGPVTRPDAEPGCCCRCGGAPAAAPFSRLPAATAPAETTGADDPLPRHPDSQPGAKPVKQILAVPSDAPGGLAAGVSAHFGHCDAFTLVTLTGGTITDVAVMPTPDHDLGGCLLPVRLLAEAGVAAIAAGGLGRRPLAAILDAGIPLYASAGYGTVGDVAAAFAGGHLPAFGPDGCCGGHDHDHDGPHGDGGDCH
jgi:predicted DNA-binding protein (UPF0251 family)/predicted Fe-Mo cluster-binding NifX family protein